VDMGGRNQAARRADVRHNEPRISKLISPAAALRFNSQSHATVPECCLDFGLPAR
jgi:hypothetical protein